MPDPWFGLHQLGVEDQRPMLLSSTIPTVGPLLMWSGVPGVGRVEMDCGNDRSGESLEIGLTLLSIAGEKEEITWKEP